MISFCTQFAILGLVKFIHSVFESQGSAESVPFFKSANGQMDKVLAFRSNVSRFDPTASAHIFISSMQNKQ